MLARSQRLTRGADYRTIVRRGRRRASAHLVSYTMVHSDASVRFGFIVSKQVGNAVVRNTVRRRLKAATWAMKDAVAPGSQIVFRALPSAASAPYSALTSDVARCLEGAMR